MSEDGVLSGTAERPATGGHWLEFWQYTIDKHQLPEASASAYRTATRRVLDVEDDPDSVDIENLDVDNILHRFRIKNETKLTGASFDTYESRFRRGREMYLSWRRREPDWAGSAVRAPKRSSNRKITKAPINGQYTPRSTQGAVPASLSPSAEDSAVPPVKATAVPSMSAMELFDYPVTLVESGITAILRLPAKYTETDAERMAALIHALAIKSTPTAG